MRSRLQFLPLLLLALPLTGCERPVVVRRLDPIIQAVPEVIDFGAIAQGRDAEFAVQLANIGRGNATIEDISLVAGNEHFEIVSYPAGLPAGEDGILVVRALTDELGSFSGAIQIEVSQIDNEPDLSTSAYIGIPNIVADIPDSDTLVIPRDEYPLGIPVFNTGDAPAYAWIEWAGFQEIPPADIDNPGVSEVEPVLVEGGSGALLPVHMVRSATAPDSELLLDGIVQSDDGTGNTFPFQVKVGDLYTAALQADPKAFLLRGSDEAQIFEGVLENIGQGPGGPLTDEVMRGSAGLSLLTNLDGATLEPGEALPFQVQWTPGLDGAEEPKAELVWRADGSEIVVVWNGGPDGWDSLAQVAVNPSRIGLGGLWLGESAEFEVTWLNFGQQPLECLIALTGDDAFTLVEAPRAAVTLGQFETGLLELTFEPETAADYAAELTFTCNDEVGEPITVQISGTALEQVPEEETPDSTEVPG